MAIERAYEADVVDVVVFGVVVASQLRKRVDYDTEDDVQKTDVQSTEDRNVEHPADVVSHAVRLGVGLTDEHVSESALRSGSLGVNWRLPKR